MDTRQVLAVAAVVAVAAFGALQAWPHRRRCARWPAGRSAGAGGTATRATCAAARAAAR
ncbi:hypothetical protein [Streptomonospora nanhaiensis]|nr:hypothetical protein [Streptomonospora nanhaiensis]MBV2362295.1 hypothetical protein [Streptomonospora nanhaiensis]